SALPLGSELISAKHRAGDGGQHLTRCDWVHFWCSVHTKHPGLPSPNPRSTMGDSTIYI
ncbi:unnamed protein product, partial [Rangifer tarandus platyrhynchus]